MKDFLIFVLGGAIGAGIAWYFTKKHYEKQIKDIRDNAEEEAVKEIAKTDKSVSIGSVEEMRDYAIGILRDIGYVVSENEAAPISDKDIPDGYYREEVNPVNDHPDEDSGDIYEIDKAVYDTTKIGEYDKNLIAFYEGDTTFVDDIDDGVVIDWKSYFGYDILNRIESHDWDEGDLYIRNEKLEADFDIVLKPCSYSEAIGEEG